MFLKKRIRQGFFSLFVAASLLPAWAFAGALGNIDRLENKNVLFVITSHDQLGDSHNKTGYWLEELAAPYEILSEAGANITLASPLGGKPPVDPISLKSAAQSKYTKMFKHDQQAQEALSKTLVLTSVHPEDYDAVFYPGGHGPLYDLADNQDSIRLIEDFAKAKKPVAVLCHSPSVLKNVKDIRGDFLVNGRKITSFSDSEEAGAALARKYYWVPLFLQKLGNGHTYSLAKLPQNQLMEKLHLKGVLPFLTEDMLKESGAHYQRKPNWEAFVVDDVTADGGVILSGQNPQSSSLLAKKLVEILVSK
ncbi:type 1 glutamine amidotransferase domain-containing protein [Acetobacteraceae bacterium]|nr:type 1 glutamine amidotransferase domain-containing protein [Acetobacteraceae bacterium]